MPADVALFPILPAWTNEMVSSGEREMAWTDDGARLTSGWLNSRTPTQFLSIRVRKSPSKLEVLDSGTKLRVKNQLNTKIKSLLVVSESGKLFFGENIADAGETVLARSSGPKPNAASPD